MTREEILQTFSDINYAYNNSTKYDTLKRMLDELTEPCEDCISREQLVRELNAQMAVDAITREVAIDMLEHLPSVQPKLKIEQEPCEDNQREFIELVVEYINPDLCTYPEYRGKPYFSIKYRENGKYIVGFGSYKIEMISQWIKEYFIPSIQPKTDVLDKIRAEISKSKTEHEMQLAENDIKGKLLVSDIYCDIVSILDKYKTEKE